MADEQVVETGADAGADAAEVVTGDEGAVNADVTQGDGAEDAGAGEGTQDDGTKPAPVVDPAKAWEGINWRHRQAAERAKRDAAWAKAAGPEILDGLADAQDELSRDWAAAGRGKAAGTQAPASTPKSAVDATNPSKAGTAMEVQPGEFAFAPDFLEQVDDDSKAHVYDPIQERFRAQEQRLARMEKYAERMEQAEQQQQIQRVTGLLKEFVSSPEIAAEFGDVYGNGDLSTMKDGDPQAQALGELYVNADAIFRRAAELGRPISEREALSRANSFLQADRIRSLERDRGRKEAAKVARTATHKPSSRTSPPVEEDGKEHLASVLGAMKGWRKKLGLGG